MKPIVCCLWPALCGLLLVPGIATALTLSPMRVVLEPSGTRAAGTFRVHNNSKSRVAVEFSMAHRDVDLEGREINMPADADFMLYPMQAVLDPDEIRTVRVSWIGDPQPDSELAFRLVCEQLPIDLVQGKPDGPRARIKLMMRYLASVYIVPQGVQPDVMVRSVSTEAGTDGKTNLVLVLENGGTAHQMLKGISLRLTPGDAQGKAANDRAVELNDDRLVGLAGTNLLAGAKRRFMLPWPEDLTPGEVQVELEIGKKR